jgi:Holliday junction DNA helicase RuvA
MIARLRGTLLESDLTTAVIDVHGLGYAVSVPMSTYDKLPRVGEPVDLHTHFHVREDTQQLFGFATVQERELFRLLITVSGVGPRLALNVLSCMSVKAFCRTILDEDVKALSKVNGIGKRSAERLVVELRERVGDVAPEAAFDAAGGESAVSREAQDAITALETLGFRADAARKAVTALCTDAAPERPTAENLIRKALSILNS